jgi:hypothetical protein
MDTSLFDDANEKISEARHAAMSCDYGNGEEVVKALLMLVEAVAELSSVTRDKVAEAASVR